MSLEVRAHLEEERAGSKVAESDEEAEEVADERRIAVDLEVVPKRSEQRHCKRSCKGPAEVVEGNG